VSDIVKQLDETLSKYIRPMTFPLAITFFKEGQELPPRTKVPTRDFGNSIAFCQGVSLARRFGWTVAFYQQDQACPVAQVILGYKEEPDFVKDGSVIKPLYAGNEAAASLTQATTPKPSVANTHCIVVMPLEKCTFTPDVVLCYGNAAQIVRMVQGSLYNEGGYVESRFAGRGACGGEFMVPFLTNKCNVIIPGGGERVFAMAADDELAFAIPGSKIESVTEGIIATHKGGVARIPTPMANLSAKPAFPPYYHKLEEYCDLRETVKLA